MKKGRGAATRRRFGQGAASVAASLAAVLAASLLSVAAVTTAPAASGSSSVATVPVSPGVLSLCSVPAMARFPDVTLDGQQQTSDASLPLEVCDDTGSGAGWQLQATSTQLSSGSQALPATATADGAAPTLTCVTAGQCTLPTNGVTYPYVLPAGAAAPAPTDLLTAAAGTGMGDVSASVPWTLSVPANTYAGSYQATWTFSLVSGPGSSGGSSGTGSSGGSITVTPPPAPTTTSYSGDPVIYTVPAGVSLVAVTATGAQGGSVVGSGGAGGSVTATAAVSPGQTFYGYVGQQPTGSPEGTVSGAPGSFGTGGAGGGGGGGGGATSVFLTDGAAPSAPTATSLGSLILVGGAGGGGPAGGPGGNPAGAGGGYGGGPGTESAGGAGADLDYAAQAGSFGLGGYGATYSGGTAGGGGGGLYGGGGGSANSNLASGGGGGSSFAAGSLSGVSYTSAGVGSGSVSFQPVGALQPTGLTGTYDQTTGGVNLSWTASPSAGVTGYAIFRDGTQLATVSGSSSTTYTDTTPPVDAQVTYGVAATTAGLSSTTVSTAVLTNAYVNVVLADQPTAFWQLNQTSGTTAVDSSGNANNGTYSGGYTLGVPGPGVGMTATSFDGSSGFVNLPNLQPSANFTFEAWVKTTPTAYEAVYRPWTSAGLGVNANGTPVGFLQYGSGDGTGAPVTGPTAINNGQWTFLAVTYNGSTEALYVNGIQVATTSISAVPVGIQTNQIGRDSALGASYFSGDIADVAVWDQTALTQAQIEAQFNAMPLVTP